MRTKTLILLLVLLVSCHNHKKSEPKVAAKPAYISKDIKANVNADSVLAILKDEKFFSDTNQFKYWTPEEAKAYVEFRHNYDTMNWRIRALFNYSLGGRALTKNILSLLMHNKVLQLLHIEDILPYEYYNPHQLPLNMVMDTLKKKHTIIMEYNTTSIFIPSEGLNPECKENEAKKYCVLRSLDEPDFIYDVTFINEMLELKGNILDSNIFIKKLLSEPFDKSLVIKWHYKAYKYIRELSFKKFGTPESKDILEYLKKDPLYLAIKKEYRIK